MQLSSQASLLDVSNMDPSIPSGRQVFKRRLVARGDGVAAPMIQEPNRDWTSLGQMVCDVGNDVDTVTRGGANIPIPKPAPSPDPSASQR